MPDQDSCSSGQPVSCLSCVPEPASAKRVRFCSTGEALEVSSDLSGTSGFVHTRPARDEDDQISSVPRASTAGCKVMDSVLPLEPASMPSSQKMHPAEIFAGQILRLSRAPKRSEISDLFDLLPKDTPARGAGAGQAFTCGMFCQGPLLGLRANSRRFPMACRVFASFVRELDPSFHFTSLSLLCNVRTTPHVDSNNAPLPNLIAGISDFSGGQVLLECASGKKRIKTGDVSIPAVALEVAGTHAIFDAYRLRHETASWTGRRLVLVAFSVRQVERLSTHDMSVLREQQFLPCMDVHCSTDVPPIDDAEYPVDCLSPKAASRFHGKSLASLLFVEVFCGTGGLCASVKRAGIGQCLGIASRVTGSTRCPVLPLDLKDKAQHALLWDVLQRDNLCGVHISPPSSDHAMFDVSAEILKWCHGRGVLVTVENPFSSPAWKSSLGKACLALGLIKTTLHQCMYGAQHAKHSTVFHNYPDIRRLSLQCDNSHTHAAWDAPSPHPVSAYPTGLCNAFARALTERLRALGCTDRSAHVVSLSRAAQVASSSQPKGKRIPPMVPPTHGTVVLRGPGSAMPPMGVLKSFTALSTELTVNPPMHGLPAGSKCLRSVLFGGGADLAPTREMAFAIPKTCDEFVQQACMAEHPRHLYSGIPEVLAKCVERCATESYESLGRERTAVLRKWVLRAQELSEEPDPDPPRGHCAEVLRGKDLRLFKQMLDASGHVDSNLPKDVKNGFDIMGPLPDSGAMPKKASFATVTPAEVRANSSATNKAILHSCKSSKCDRISTEVFRLTCEEKEKGWLDGPHAFPLPEGAVLTRRFGVEQSSTQADGSTVDKTRPIDDYTESQVNLTNASTETISPHGIDVIIAGICRRVLSRPATSSPENLTACTIDLRKAYKQLPVSERSLNDCFLCVHDPSTSSPTIFRTRVLPFGARAAVNGFCRCSLALFWIGAALLHLHWSCFFDDYFLVGAVEEAKHLHIIQKGFFDLLGWATSSEKESGFGELARVLGVCVSFAEIRLGWVAVMNTEHRKRDLCNLLDSLISKGVASCHELTVLRGRLLFADNQVYGRRSRQVFSVLSRACSRKKCTSIRGELLHALLFFRDRIVAGGPRRVNACVREKLTIFTDASFESEGSGLGGILYDSSARVLKWFSEWIDPCDLVPFGSELKDGLIYELEVFAAVQGALDLLSDRSHVDVVLFTDNEAALACLIGGRAEGVAACILQKLICFEEENDVCFWFEWVPTQSNPSDAPSRKDFNKLDASLRIRLSSLSP